MSTPSKIPPIALGPPGAVSTINRIVAGAPVELTWPGEETPMRAFLAKAIRWTYDETVTVGELYNLVYGIEDPLLSTDAAGRPLVTRETHADPAWSLLMELIDRKRVAVGHLEPAPAAAHFDMSVSEAALALERSTSAIRQLIARGRLPARKEGDSYLLDRAAVLAFRGLRRGPRSIAKASDELAAGAAAEKEDEDEDPPAAPESSSEGASVEVRIGHEAGKHVRIKGARLASPRKEGTCLAGKLEPGWKQLHVLAYDADGKARLFVFEPAAKGALDWQFGSLFVRGDLREVEHENNPRRARERFEAAPKGTGEGS